jgi:2,5-diketo-D-gluconate reductase A
VETWEALVELRDNGLVGSIGTSNFAETHLDRLVDEVGVAPVLNQVELHPLFQQPQLVAHHDRLGIVTEAWSPLGRGRVLEHPVLRDIAARHDATVAQVVLRWHLDLGRAVVPKSVNPARIAANLDLEGISLAAEDLAAIARIDTGRRTGPDPATFV